MKISANSLPMDKLVFTKDLSGFDKGFENEGKVIEFIDNTYFIINRVREECSLIEVSTNATGHRTYDLPRAIKLSKGKNRPRRDGYTSLLLANYGARCYLDLVNANYRAPDNKFVPFVL